MILPVLFGVLFLIIITVCLPQLLLILVVGAMGYILCRNFRRKHQGIMILILCGLICLDVVMQEIMPTINKAYETKEELTGEVNKVRSIFGVEEVENEIDESKKKLEDGKNKIDKTVEDASNHPIWKFLWKSPNEKEDK